MKRQVVLDYTLGAGWLAPWLDGLRNGTAVASQCGACGDAHFPPLRHCTGCGSPSDGWKTLPGTATVLFRTHGADGDVALVRFDGAAGAAVVGAGALPAEATRGAIAASPDDPPVISLVPEPAP